MATLVFMIGVMLITGIFIVLDDGEWERGKK